MSFPGRTDKQLSNRDAFQTLQGAFNEEDFSITQAGFLVGKVGRRIEVGGAGAVETYTFLEDGDTLYVLTLTYTDGTKTTLLSAERTA
jgi:hypothetical protein